MISLLAPHPGERILDVGCGTGNLSRKLVESGAWVVGMDRAQAMLTEARRAYQDFPLGVADVRQFSSAEPFDAVFSNAVLH